MKNTDQFVFMADAHIKGRTWTNYMGLQGDAYAALDLVSEKLKGIDTLVIGGDWFDSNHPSSTDINQSFQFLRQFKSVFFIRGNHDNVQPSYLSALSEQGGQTTVTELQPGEVYTPSIDFNLAGIPWMASRADLLQALEQTRQALEGKPGRSFVVLHTSCRHLLGFDGSWQLEAADLEQFKRMPVTFLIGDIHKRDTLQLSDSCSLHSPGSLYPLSWDRVGDSCSVSVVNSKTAEIHAVPSDVRSYTSLDFTNMQDLNQVIEGLVEDNKRAGLPCRPFIRVNVSGTTGYSYRALVDGAVVQAVDNSLPELTTSTTAEQQTTMEDIVRAECEADSDIADMAVSLLSSADPLSDVSSWLDYWGVERLN